MKTVDTINTLTMSDLVGRPFLRKYLSNVRDWHGYVRFLGLPDLRDNRDILIDRLFVEPLLMDRHISADEDPSSWLDEAETIFEVLKTGKPVVLLGDPGTGKVHVGELFGVDAGTTHAKQLDGKDGRLAAAFAHGTARAGPS